MEDAMKHALCAFLKEAGHTPHVCQTCKNRAVTEVGGTFSRRRIVDYCPVNRTYIVRWDSCMLWREDEKGE